MSDELSEQQWKDRLRAKGWAEGADGSWTAPSRRGAVGGMEAHRPEPAALPALDRRVPEPAGGAPGVEGGCSFRWHVKLVALRRRLLDFDAVAYSMKPLQDAVAETIGLDDADGRITWEHSQEATSGSEGVLVKVERTT